MSGVTDSTAAQTRWSVLILLHTTFLCARFSHINPPPRVIKGAASRVTSAAWMHSKSSTSRVARFGRWRHRFHSSSSPPHSRYACPVGTIPPKIGLLASMVVLVLGSNRLSGRRSHVASLRSHDERPCLTKKARVVALFTPLCAGSSPRELSNLKKLKVLDLRSNCFEGTVGLIAVRSSSRLAHTDATESDYYESNYCQGGFLHTSEHYNSCRS